MRAALMRYSQIFSVTEYRDTMLIFSAIPCWRWLFFPRSASWPVRQAAALPPGWDLGSTAWSWVRRSRQRCCSSWALRESVPLSPSSAGTTVSSACRSFATWNRARLATRPNSPVTSSPSAAEARGCPRTRLASTLRFASCAPGRTVPAGLTAHVTRVLAMRGRVDEGEELRQAFRMEIGQINDRQSYLLDAEGRVRASG